MTWAGSILKNLNFSSVPCVSLIFPIPGCLPCLLIASTTGSGDFHIPLLLQGDIKCFYNVWKVRIKTFGDVLIIRQYSLVLDQKYIISSCTR